MTMMHYSLSRASGAWHAVAKRAGSVVLTIVVLTALAHTQQLYWLGSVGGDFGAVYHIADNGVAVGYSKDSDFINKPIVWDATNGLRVLPTLGGTFGEAWHCTPDGSRIVGFAANAQGRQRAVLWERAADGVNYTVLDLGTLGGTSGAALGISPDGNFITGWMSTAANTYGAFLYDVQNRARLGLGTLGGTHSIGRRVTVVGNVIIVAGSAQITTQSSGDVYRPFRWTSNNNQMVNLGAPFGQSGPAYAYDMSLDGQTIVGEAPPIPDRWAAYRWQNGSFTRLDGPPNFSYNSSALETSANGSIIVGFGRNSLGWATACRWVNGVVENLNLVYRDLLRGGFLTQARGISPNGRYIGGFGYNAATYRYEPFVLDTQACVTHDGDVDDNRCVDDADLLAVLFAFGNTGSNLGRVDVNCDEVVDDADLLQVLFNFGSGC
jgi:probable HAF family extracellular repeat protein